MSGVIWYFARSAGLVAYLLLSASVVVGVLMSARVRFTWPRFAVEEVHRFLTVLTGVFVTLHGTSLLVDRVVPISIVQVLVPFTSSYRPFAVGLGVTAAELMAAVALTNQFKRRLPYSVWRKVHYLTLAVWALASLHGVLAGTDRGVPWFTGVVAGAFSAVCLALVVRTRALLAAQA